MQRREAPGRRIAGGYGTPASTRCAPGDGLALGDGHGGRHEDELTAVAAELDGRGVGAEGEGEGGNAGKGEVGRRLHGQGRKVGDPCVCQNSASEHGNRALRYSRSH